MPEVQSLSNHRRSTCRPFGKWGEELERRIGRGTPVVLAGVSTDCCVISTALAGADAGGRITIATDACAGPSAENHAAALTVVVGLYPQQVTVATTDECRVLLSGSEPSVGAALGS